MFPTLLKQLVAVLNNENLISGFLKCGIYPLDRNQVLSRLPTELNPQEASQQIDGCLFNMLKSSSGRGDAAPKRGSKVSFSPGKAISVSVAAAESEDESDTAESEDELDTAESEDESDSYSVERIDNDCTDNHNGSKAPAKGSLKVSDWVVVKYETSTSKFQSCSFFPEQTIEVISNAVLKISVVRPQYSSDCTPYKWPHHDDIDNCDFDNIIELLPNPKMTRRGAIMF